MFSRAIALRSPSTFPTWSPRSRRAAYGWWNKPRGRTHRMHMSDERVAKLGKWAPLGFVLGFGLIFIARTAFYAGGKLHFTLFDDAMISMQYAKNLAHGHGMVWMAGGPKVE